MRGLTLAGAAVALFLVVAVTIFIRSEDPAPPPAATVAEGARAKPGGSVRSSRVEERLQQLRQDFEQRQPAGDMQPAVNKREVPTAAQRNPVDEGMMGEEEGSDDEDPEEMEELRTTLFNDPDPDERMGAVLMLTGDEGPESLRMLLEAMGDPDPEVRLAVVEALGDRAEELAPSTLAGAMRDPDPEVRFEAVSILGDMEDNDEALQMVGAAKSDPDGDVQQLAEGILDFADEDDGDDDGDQPPTQPTAQQ
ncbi:MAG: HEAT repeat domain-containing protein [Candidatus Binatia bacterium]